MKIIELKEERLFPPEDIRFIACIAPPLALAMAIYNKIEDRMTNVPTPEQSAESVPAPLYMTPQTTER